MSQHDISEHIEDLYGMPLSAQSVSKMTDKIIHSLKNSKIDH